MSCRRSTRIASKSSAPVSEKDVDLVFEEAEAQHFNLRTRTPKTCRRIGQTPSQKRKRLPSTASTPSVSDVPEVGRGVEVKLNSNGSPSVDFIETPKVLTQSRFRNQADEEIPTLEQGTKDKDTASGNVDAGFDYSRIESSPGNASFLHALDQLEEKHLLTNKAVAVAAETDEPEDLKAQDLPPLEICVSEDDVFGDDSEILKALKTPPNTDRVRPPLVTPKIRKRSLRSNNVSPALPNSSGHDNAEEAEYAHGPHQVIDLGVEVDKEPKPKRSRRRSDGEKKIGKNQAQPKKKKKKKEKGKFKLAFTNRKAIQDLANSASNELSKDDLSSYSSEEKLLLSSWGLPTSVLNNYRQKGITSLFPWQLECLANERVLEGKNLLYSAPTSAGKTLVSEILMIKRVLELGRKAIMILPFVSVAREKVYSLQSIFGDAGIRVEGFMGSVNPPGGFKAVDIAVCTIEKANSLVNKLLEEDSLADLGTLVVDELHLIGDPHRGYLLELLLTKILYMTSIKNRNTENSLNLSNPNDASWRPRRYHIQVIGMSATLPNLDLLAGWLNAELYVTDFRPVPLKERLKLDDKMLDEELQPVRDVKVEDIPVKIEGDSDDIIYLTLETVLNGFSVLIFCPTKASVEKTAERIALQFFKIGDPNKTEHPEIGNKLRNQLNGARIKSVLLQLQQCPGGVDEVLARTVMFGIGYHHAGLTYENRDLVESAFKRGILKVIVATSTLSAGVNLPARRVMIVTPMFNGSILDTMTYRQMCGRAGRNGIDTEGESILICPPTLKEKGMRLYRGAMPLVKSALLGDETLTSAMKRALLEAVASGIATLTSDVRSYSKCTFLFHSLDAGLYPSEELTASQVHKESTVEECLRYLESQDFIRLKQFEQEDRPEEYMPTQLGSACLASSLSPDDGIIVYKELLKARECLVLEIELHIIYQVTPIYVSDQLRYISWSDYLRIWGDLNVSELKVAELVGIKERFIVQAMIGTASWANPSQRPDMAIHQRFYAALALSDLVNEMSLDDVGRKYGLNKGVLQNLQQAASTFAGMITAFCGRLGWSNLELLLSQFQERLEFGVQRELCDLVRIECLNGQRARILYDAGLKTIIDLAAADPAQVEHILHKATPFKSDVHGVKESYIWMIGKDTLTEAQAAQKIVDQARTFIKIEFGQQGHVQFSFGNNAIPSASRKSGNQSFKGEHTSIKLVDAELNLGTETGERENETRKNNSGVRTEQAEKTNAAEVEADKDCFIEDLFSQRPVELESSLHQHQQLSILENSQDMFEESFPEICVSNISSLYPKTEKPETPKAQGFSIQKHIEKLDSLSNEQQHSTPLLNNRRKPHRFTLDPDDHGSPLCSNRSAQAHGEGEEKDVENHIEYNRWMDKNIEEHELSDCILAELDNDFESFKNSISIKSVKNEKDGETGHKSDLKMKQDSIQLNESDAEAMRAIANDSNFESEELFPVTETNRGEHREDGSSSDQKNSPAAITTPKRRPAAENLLDGLDEEDFILTQAPVIYSETQTETDTFEESSSDTESSPTASESVSTNEFSSSFSYSSFPDPEPTELEEIVGSVKLVVKIVHSAEQIPKDFFAKSKMLGVGLKLATPRKSSTSLARQGIGANIIGKGANKTIAHNNDEQNLNSIAFFNGTEVIWVFRWTDANVIGVASKKRKPDVLFKLVKLHHCALAIFNCKEMMKSLMKACGTQVLNKLPPCDKMWDPRIAQWMWEFDDQDWNITKEKIVNEYVSSEDQSISNLGWGKEVVDAFYAWKVMHKLKPKLESKGLWNHFTNTEMPSVLPLMLMELNGLGLDTTQMSKLRQILQFKSAVLELRAFQLAGRQFNMASPKEIKQVLYHEIGLKQPRSKGTSKDVLLKLDHALPLIIIEWRKVASALSKFVTRFQQERSLETGRVHGHYSFFTVTGRVTMNDPSLQCIPRDFDLSNFSYTPHEIDELKHSCRLKFGSKLASLFKIIDNSDSLVNTSSLNKVNQISMRNAFVPCNSDFAMLAADYSQLELRILAHLSKDNKLLAALNQDTDVFVEIASEWKKLPKENITYSIRQEAKGIVYGVIYGMGAKALSEQMEIDEREAGRFMDQFMRTYPGVSRFINETKRLCREKGYIETMMGRRRYLPLINSLKSHEKAKAERQAVNSQIQGSAAELVKTAMSRIHSVLSSKYPKSSLPIEWDKVANIRKPSSLNPRESHTIPASSLENVIFMPILNLHDELIFEVRKTHLKEVAEIIQKEMESCIQLKVKLPVVVKTGESWGSLENYG